ncbi:MAG: DUF1700 domain-containing protein [Clostridiaceae bacterium]
MDMNNYLKSLNDKIRSLPDGYRKEILKDYKNHFEEGLLTGKTENDIAFDLGDVDTIAKNIIEEYSIKNYKETASSNNISKALSAVASVGIGALNFLVVWPFILSAAIFVISLYILDFCLLATPVFLIANLISPALPISFGTEILWLKLLYVLTSAILGYFLYKGLIKISRKFFPWLLAYFINSIKFQVFRYK